MTDLPDERPSDVSSYWTVSTTSMREAEAIAAAAAIADDYPGVHAFAVDPREHMTLLLDRWTAQMIRDAISARAEAGKDTGNMVEDFDEWLGQAADDDPDDGSQ